MLAATCARTVVPAHRSQPSRAAAARLQATGSAHGGVLHAFNAPTALLRSSAAAPSRQLAAIPSRERSRRLCRVSASGSGSQDSKPDMIEEMTQACEIVDNLKDAETLVGFALAYLEHVPSVLRGQLGARFLHAAARNPQMEAGASVIRALCEAGANVAARDEAGNQAIHIAVQMDCQAAAQLMAATGSGADLAAMLAGEAAPPHVQALLDCRAPVNRHGGGYTPLHLAVGCQTHPGTMRGLVTALLKSGADPAAPAANQLAFHPIHIATAFNGHPGAAAEAIRLLVAAGESPSAAAGPEQVQPLHCVMDNPSVKAAGEVTQLLIQLGADQNGRRTGGRTPLIEACGFSKSPAVAETVMTPLLEANADPNAANEDGWTCAAAAAINPNHAAAAAALRLLSAYGADCNRPAKDGRTPLSIAACQEWRNVPALLACGADPNITDQWGMNALHYTCSRAPTAGDATVAIEALLAAGADVNLGTAQGRKPVHYAAMHENGEVAVAAIRLLAKAPGFDPNARRSREEQGANALHTAALRRSDGGRATTAIIEALLEAGADVNALNDEGWCALEDAYINPYPPGDAAARALWAAGGRYYMPDPKTGKWIGPDSLADIVDPALRRASSSRVLALEEARSGSMVPLPGTEDLWSFMTEVVAAAKELKKREANSAADPLQSPDLASFLRAKGFGQSGPGGQAPGQQQGKDGGSKK